MSKSTELLKLQEESQHNSQSSKESLIKYTEVPNTYFTLITKENQTKIAIGYTVVSKKTFNSEEEALEYIDQKPWELITLSGAILATKKIELEKKL